MNPGLPSGFGHGPLDLVYRGLDFATKAGVAWFLFLAAGLPAATNETALEEAAPALPRAPRPEIPPTHWDQYGFWIVVAGMVLLLLLGVLVWWLGRPKPKGIEPQAVRARHELEPLREQAENGWILSRVSQVLRHYFAGAFNLPQAEVTTSEFCRLISGSEQIGLELSAGMGDFLRECDRRKFAPLPALPPLGAVAQAAKFIEQAEARRDQLLQAAAAEAARARSATGGSRVPTAAK